MTKKVIRCFVEIFAGANMITFNFGNWAIVIFHNADKDDDVTVYFDSDFDRYFICEIDGMIDDRNLIKNIEINSVAFNEIKLAAKACQKPEINSREYTKLWNLLNDNFAKHVQK